MPSRTPQEIIAEITRIRNAVLNDPTIKPNDARWKRAIIECHALWRSLPNLHPDYYDDPNYRK